MSDPERTGAMTVRATAPRRSRAVVVGPTSVETYPLPDGETLLSVGRSSDCDITIDDPGVSRVHLRIHVANRLEVEDLHSANGSLVMEDPLVPGVRTAIQPGEPIRLGETTLILEHVSIRPRRLWQHGYFEARVDEECARARDERRSFSVVMVRIDTADQVKGALFAMGAVLRRQDVVGRYAPDEVEVLLPDVSGDESSALERALHRALDHDGIGGTIGRAIFPRDGRSAGELIESSRESLLGAPAKDGRDVLIVAPSMKTLYEMVDRVATSEINVLLMGETGVGKDVVAEQVHRRSRRSEGPFLRLNCAALPNSIVESELFGYEKGAFTGADVRRVGLLESASGGTVFLDEIGELPLEVQAKMLRVLEDRSLIRVGGREVHPIDVRFLSATNRDLVEEVEAGRFRQDLYFRLNGITLTVPPLRERVEEIRPLAELFVRTFAERDRRRAPALGPSALAALDEYPFPGNIRELKNIIERAVLLCTMEELTPSHLQLDRMPGVTFEASPSVPRAATASGKLDVKSLQEEMRRFERSKIEEALAACGGNQTRAAELLGISRRTLVQRITDYGLREKGAP